jgi:hypothetical protein
MLKSAETGEDLYCECCDMRDQRNDAQTAEEGLISPRTEPDARTAGSRIGEQA